MNLKLFPLDTQTCHLTIASYGWTAADLVYLWKVINRSYNNQHTNHIHNHQHPNPVQLAVNLFLPSITVAG